MGSLAELFLGRKRECWIDRGNRSGVIVRLVRLIEQEQATDSIQLWLLIVIVVLVKQAAAGL